MNEGKGNPAGQARQAESPAGKPAQADEKGKTALKYREDAKGKADRAVLLGPVSALYAVFYTFCLYKNADGITYPFFAAGTLLCFFCYMKRCGVPWKKENGFYAAGVVLLGITVCLTDDWKLQWMSKTGIFILAVMLALSCFYHTGQWDFPKFIGAGTKTLTGALKSIGLPFSDSYAGFWKEGTANRKEIAGVALGLLIGMPLLLIILALLLSADAVFEDMFERMAGDFSLQTMADICLMTAAAFVLFYAFLASLSRRQIPEQCPQRRKAQPLAAITFTSLIAFVYLIFSGIQIIYLFAGRGGLPEGLTWAGYARQGFFQLLFVCLINLALVVVCMALFQDSRILKGLLTAISLMTYILIASSGYRMILYIQNYYLTFLRLFVLWALLVLSVLFAGVILSVYNRRFPLLRYFAAVITSLYLVFAFARPDYWIAKYDLSYLDASFFTESMEKRDEIQGKQLGYSDLRYLSELSADAAPALAQRELVAFFMDEEACHTRVMQYYYDRIEEKSDGMGLRTLNLSRWRARGCLAEGGGAGNTTAGNGEKTP